MKASSLRFHQTAVRHLCGLLEAYREWVRTQEVVFDRTPEASALREVEARGRTASADGPPTAE